MAYDKELYINHFRKVLSTLNDDELTHEDENIKRFIYNLDNNIVSTKKPIPTELRVSTMSAKCKITREVMIERFITIIFNMITEHKDDEPYILPFVGLKYRDMEINVLNNGKKKKKNKFL